MGIIEYFLKNEAVTTVSLYREGEDFCKRGIMPMHSGFLRRSLP